MMTPEVRYAIAEDGARIAYSRMGNGPVLVETPHSGFGGLTALTVPAFRAYYDALTAHMTVVTYDTRGLYNSSRGTFDYSQDSHAADLDAVISAANLDAFHLFAAYHTSAGGISWVAANPERVRSLLVWQGFADGEAYSQKTATAALRPLVTNQLEMFAAAAAAVARPPTIEDERSMADFLARQLGVHEQPSGRQYLEAAETMSAVGDAKTIRVPTLVLYREGAKSPPPEFARELASLIPGAQLRPLGGDSHVPSFGDIAETVGAITNFVDTPAAPESVGEPHVGSFQTLMFTDIESSTALTQRLGDEAAQDVLHGHNDAVRKSLEEHGGREVKHTGDGIMAAFPSAVRAGKRLNFQPTGDAHMKGFDEPVALFEVGG